MKVLVFGGGLGNQLFGYAFYCYLRDKFPKEKIYGIYDKKRLSEHYGLEIDKWFKVKLPPQKWYATIVVGILYVLKKIFGYTANIDLSRRECQNINAIVYFAFKLNNQYIPNYNFLEWKIDESTLSPLNKRVFIEIRNSNSVFIHVRRGDFLSETYKKLFEGCCPIEYYKKTVKDILEKVEQPRFFCFSDDLDWVKQNLQLPNAEYIDWNQGEDSPLDMFLMSQCKYAIMANSTFSYWATLLGKKKEIVYYPQKWDNHPYGSPKIFYDYWISY